MNVLLMRLMVVLLLSVFSQQLVAENKMSVRVALGEWPPFIGSNLKNFGSVSHVVSEAFKSQGYQVEFGFFPWKRSFDLTRLSDWDGTAVWVKSPEREKHFLFSDSLMTSSSVFFYRKDMAFDWKTLDDLKGYTIGGSTGYYHGTIIDEGERKGIFKMDRITDEYSNFKKLLIGRVDLVVANREVGNYLLNKVLDKEQRKEITYHANVAHTATYHLIISKKNPRAESLMQAFNRGLALRR